MSQEQHQQNYAGDDLFHLFVEHVPVGLAMFDRNMRYLQASRRWKSDLNLGERDLRGLSHYEVFPDLDEHWKEIHRRSMAGEVIRADEDQYQRRDGFVMWLRWEVRPWFDGTGAVGGILIFFEDIAERKRAEGDRARLAAIVESSEDAIVSKSLDGTILTWNAGAQHLFGYTPHEAIGRSITLIIPPERLQEEDDILARISRGERLQHYETVRMSKAGRRLDISLTISPIRDSQGQIVGASKIARDVSAYKLAEHTLRQREALLRSAAENASVGLVMLDRNRRYVFANTAYVQILDLPWKPEDLLGSGPEQVLPESYPTQIAPRLDRAYAGERVSYELTRPDTRGEMAYYMVVYDPKSNPSGAIDGVIVTIFNITISKRAEQERRKLELQIQQTQKLESLGILAGGIAHDFNNILTSVLGYADLALRELPSSSSARVLIHEAINGARKAADLTRQMLAYSGKGKFIVETLNLNDVVEDMVHLLQVSITKKCVLKLHLMPALASIEADAVQVRQIIMNLIINASDAIGDRSGVIAVTTGVMHCDRAYLSETYLDENLPEGFYTYIEVADTGCGMTEEIRARIFDPFFTTKTTGRGLGLAAVLGIVRGHRGALKVYSEVGKGTTFKVAFPAVDLPAQLQPKPHAPNESWKGTGTILVVDDEEAVRGLARRMLEMMGFTVRTACDGREGVEVFRNEGEQIQLVLLDMTMPHLDGQETFRELRRLRNDVKVILSSGYNEHSAISQFAGKGLVGFIQKPYSYDDLKDIVRKVLDR